MTEITIGCLDEDTPKAVLINNACHMAVDALRAAHFDLVNRWSNFLLLDGTFGKKRSRIGNTIKQAETDSGKRRKQNKLNVQENAITSEFETPIRSHLCRAQLKDATVVPQLSCHFQAQVASNTRTGDSLKKADIRFQMVNSESSEFDVVFEAKVLRKESEIESEYLGDAGLKRFCRKDDPYTIGKVGGLLAYVDNVNYDTYKLAVRASVDSHSTRLEFKEAALGLSGTEKEICSSHKCENDHRDPIWMIHLMMGFPTMHVDG